MLKRKAVRPKHSADEAADATAVDAIISGDTHLLELKTWKARILSPAQFIAEFEGLPSG